MDLQQRPQLQAVLRQLAEVQTCACCCLRVAGARSAGAYASAAAAPSAAHFLRQLAGGAAEGGDVSVEQEGQQQALGTPAVGLKRRREEEEGASNGAAAAPDSATEAAAAAATTPESSALPSCPLCFGLLPALFSCASVPAECISLQVLLPPATWRPLPQGQPQSDPAHGLPAELGAEREGETQQQQQQPWRQHAAPSPQECAPVACSSLAAVAGLLAEEFEFGASGDNLAAAAVEGRGFALEVAVPAAVAVRAQALWWRLVGALGAPALLAAGLSSPRDIVDVKDAVRLCAGAAMSQVLGQPVSSSASLTLTLTVTHAPSAPEAAWLAPPAGRAQQGGGKKGGGRGRGGGRGWWGGRGPAGGTAAVGGAEEAAEPPWASTSLARRLEEMTQAAFLERCPASAAQLRQPASAAGATAGSATELQVQLTCSRKPFYVGGRYLKLRRFIPQSPWFLDGGRRGETSVEEEVVNRLLPRLRPDAFSFISAGREDYDVRMLGSGRPFAVEVRNARRRPPSPAGCAEVEAAINQGGSGVEVRRLSVLDPSLVALLKEGESEKEKSYAAVCWLPRPLTDGDIELLGSTRDLLIQQRTPIRVLHRRANLVRPRTIYALRAERLPGQEHYFVLHLRTQAGTYIKEFVHGDMGRTRPCLRDLLGCQAQILCLDVEEIHLDFLN